MHLTCHAVDAPPPPTRLWSPWTVHSRRIWSPGQTLESNPPIQTNPAIQTNPETIPANHYTRHLAPDPR